MEIELSPGKYVVAVSGGVDSVVLLDLLNELNDITLVVAHFDHGIRADSSNDQKFVQELASNLKLEFHAKEGKLGEATSEEKARKARYDFLKGVVSSTKADGLIT